MRFHAMNGWEKKGELRARWHRHSAGMPCTHRIFYSSNSYERCNITEIPGKVEYQASRHPGNEGN